jgi:hypothetical protein
VPQSRPGRGLLDREGQLPPRWGAVELDARNPFDPPEAAAVGRHQARREPVPGIQFLPPEAGSEDHPAEVLNREAAGIAGSRALKGGNKPSASQAALGSGRPSP